MPPRPSVGAIRATSVRLLVGLLGDAVKYEVRNVNGPGSQGMLLIKNPEANLKRLYSPPPAPIWRCSRATPWAPMLKVSPSSIVEPRSNKFYARDGGQSYKSNAGYRGDVRIKRSHPWRLHSESFPEYGTSLGRERETGHSHGSESAFQLTKDHRQRRSHRSPAILVTSQGYSETRIPIGQMTLEADRAPEAAQQQLAGDVQAIDAYNTVIRDSNQNVRQVLSGAVGTDLGEDRVAWEKWVTDLSGYAYVSPTRTVDDTPTYEEEVPLDYQPQPSSILSGPPQITTIAIQRVQHNCFAAGTPVQTMDGLCPIEKLRVGDQVLTQDPKSGELKYQPLLAVYHNPPNETLRIGLGKETIVATGIHRLWKAGKGWTMAREFKLGDPLRTLEGLAVVMSIEKDRVQPVFNMHVAEGESFFVGKQGVLAHDNSQVNPTPSPFDAVPDLRTTARP